MAVHPQVHGTTIRFSFRQEKIIRKVFHREDAHEKRLDNIHSTTGLLAYMLRCTQAFRLTSKENCTS